MKYVFMNTTKRAMGNAYKVWDTLHNCYVVILCEYGIRYWSGDRHRYGRQG